MAPRSRWSAFSFDASATYPARDLLTMATESDEPLVSDITDLNEFAFVGHPKAALQCRTPKRRHHSEFFLLGCHMECGGAPPLFRSSIRQMNPFTYSRAADATQADTELWGKGKGEKHNSFKVELAKRAIVRALSKVAGTG